jgi:AAA15 family ATPase/GTPase
MNASKHVFYHSDNKKKIRQLGTGESLFNRLYREQGYLHLKKKKKVLNSFLSPCTKPDSNIKEFKIRSPETARRKHKTLHERAAFSFLLCLF